MPHHSSCSLQCSGWEYKHHSQEILKDKSPKSTNIFRCLWPWVLGQHPKSLVTWKCRSWFPQQCWRDPFADGRSNSALRYEQPWFILVKPMGGEGCRDVAEGRMGAHVVVVHYCPMLFNGSVSCLCNVAEFHGYGHCNNGISWLLGKVFKKEKILRVNAFALHCPGRYPNNRVLRLSSTMHLNW